MPGRGGKRMELFDILAPLSVLVTAYCLLFQANS